jgi:hypothetical protein
MPRTRSDFSNAANLGLMASSSLVLISSLFLLSEDVSYSVETGADIVIQGGQTAATIEYDETKPPIVTYGTGADAVDVPCKKVTDPAEVKDGYITFRCEATPPAPQ